MSLAFNAEAPDDVEDAVCGVVNAAVSALRFDMGSNGLGDDAREDGARFVDTSPYRKYLGGRWPKLGHTFLNGFCSQGTLNHVRINVLRRTGE